MPLPTDFLVDRYDRLHDTPTQQKFRRIEPMPCGVVFIQQPGWGEAEIRGHFRLIRQCGFTCLKGIGVLPGTDARQVMHWALDEGLVPWWYDQGGWEEITDELLHKLGIDPALPIERIREHPAMREHQLQVMRRRIDHPGVQPRQPDDEEDEVPFSFDGELHPKARPHFLAWLRRRYETIERLREAWGFGWILDKSHGNFASWDTLGETLDHAMAGDKGFHGRDFRRVCDLLRFKADVYLDKLRRRMQAARESDPHEPHRAGGEMGLFLPFAARATDMEGIGDVMAEYGSFYPSVHLGWHFEEVGFEVARPAYMMSSLIADWGKGIWCAAWESTGGPQQVSGGKAPFWEGARDKTPGFTVDGGVMTQLMLSYLAGGFRGFGFWCWTSRSAGFEVGEYALTDRQHRACERTIQAGRIAQAAQRYRHELWKAHKEPLVGVFVDFDLSAMWAAISVKGRDFFKHIPMQARVGASRALIDANIPWEHVTSADLRNGLAGRYRVIYMPAAVMLASDIGAILLDYARRGGRVVLDLPGGMVDEFGRRLDTDHGTTFEQLFGCLLRDVQYSSNVPRALDGRALTGFVADLAPTRARTLAAYDGGGAAVTEATVGEGSAVILGYEASLACLKPGNAWAQERLARWTMGDLRSPYACDGAIAYRLAAPGADHYFLINDGPATTARLDTKAYRYASARDAVSGEPIDVAAPIPLPAYSGRWLRMGKAL
jgi:beta-galactosidase